MKLKLDENLGRSARALFAEGGHDVQTVREEGLSGSPDSEIIDACRREARCLVTLDLDFSNPLLFRPSDYFGIAVLRPRNKPSPADLLVVCRTLVAALESSDISGKLWSVEPGRVREYRPGDSEEN